jgi:ribonuclease BN (tRNA processing enzyme)
MPLNRRACADDATLQLYWFAPTKTIHVVEFIPQLVLHEATLLNRSNADAASIGHSTPHMAGMFAAAVRPKALVLTHFSSADASSFVDAHIDAFRSAHSLEIGND